MRELEGFLKRVQAYAQINNQTVTLPLVKEIMRDLLPPEQWDEEDRVVASQEGAAGGAPRAAPAPAPEVRAHHVTPAISPGAIEIDAAPPPVAAVPADSQVKSVPVAFFFPHGKGIELNLVKRKFEDVVRKHKLKFQLDPVLETPYVLNEDLSYGALAERCQEKSVKIAIVLGPPSEGSLISQEFHQKIQEVFDVQRLSLQLIPWEELRKDYRYLNLALDITLVRFRGGR